MSEIGPLDPIGYSPEMDHENEGIVPESAPSHVTNIHPHDLQDIHRVISAIKDVSLEIMRLKERRGQRKVINFPGKLKDVVQLKKQQKVFNELMEIKETFEDYFGDLDALIKAHASSRRSKKRRRHQRRNPEEVFRKVFAEAVKDVQDRLGLIMPGKPIKPKDIDDIVRSQEDTLDLSVPTDMVIPGLMGIEAEKVHSVGQALLENGEVGVRPKGNPKLSLERVPPGYRQKIDACLERAHETVAPVVLEGSIPARFIGKDIFVKENFDPGYPLEVMTSKIQRHFLRDSEVLCPETLLLKSGELSQPKALSRVFGPSADERSSCLVMRKFKGMSFWEGLGLQPAFKKVNPARESIKEHMPQFAKGLGKITVVDVLIGNNDRIWGYEMLKKPYYEMHPHNLMVQSDSSDTVDRLIAIDNEPHKLNVMWRKLRGNLKSARDPYSLIRREIDEELREVVDLFSNGGQSLVDTIHRKLDSEFCMDWDKYGTNPIRRCPFEESFGITAEEFKENVKVGLNEVIRDICETDSSELFQELHDELKEAHGNQRSSFILKMIQMKVDTLRALSSGGPESTSIM